jgi:P-type conjugative transfer ATPase TrbB
MAPGAQPRPRGVTDGLRSSLKELGAGKRAGEKSLRRLSNSRSTCDVPSDERGVPPHLQSELSESQARRASALKSTLGPLATFLDDPRVVEVMLNADGVVWIDRIGEGLLRTSVTMSAVDAERMLRLVASEVLVELNAQSPSLSAKLPAPWGARLQAAIPPIVDAPVFALRKPARVVFSLEDYVARGILSAQQAGALTGAVHVHDNILIGGGTGSGKTTFANALVKVIAEDTTDRVHIVEDTPELQCAAPNRVQVLVQPGVHTWRDAIMAAMRFRPDRILVGEVRDGSALELLKAWNTGHPGGVATIHANDTRAMLDRLCQLIEEVVYPAPRALVAQTIQVCVHIQRDKTHPAGRRVSGLDRVRPLGPDGQWILERIA